MNDRETHRDRVAYQKAYAFAIRMVHAFRYLQDEKREFVLSRQMLRCGTSIGANLAEAEGAFSRAEFAAKVAIAYKECRETQYWLSLLKDTGYIDERTHASIFADADELGALLYRTVQTSRTSQ